MLLVEPKLLLTTPAPYLIAGIGDTLAKWYEADALTENMTDQPLAVQISRNARSYAGISLLPKEMLLFVHCKANVLTVHFSALQKRSLWLAVWLAVSVMNMAELLAHIPFITD
nr:hypothetical protein [Terribacillus saccharophilus]